MRHYIGFFFFSRNSPIKTFSAWRFCRGRGREILGHGLRIVTIEPPPIHMYKLYSIIYIILYNIQGDHGGPSGAQRTFFIYVYVYVYSICIYFIYIYVYNIYIYIFVLTLVYIYPSDILRRPYIKYMYDLWKPHGMWQVEPNAGAIYNRNLKGQSY